MKSLRSTTALLMGATCFSFLAGCSKETSVVKPSAAAVKTYTEYVFVVDKVVIDPSKVRGSVDPDNIQSIQVVKPTSDAMREELVKTYGPKALNGVMYVTTRKPVVK